MIGHIQMLSLNADDVVVFTPNSPVDREQMMNFRQYAERAFKNNKVLMLDAGTTLNIVRTRTPVPMLLFCPNCRMQHIDPPDTESVNITNEFCPVFSRWTNPPHKSHLCRIEDNGCGTVWRPSDVETTGVVMIETRGKSDTWPRL